MSAPLDDVLVGLAVAASVVYAALVLGPRSWRRQGLAFGARLSARLGLDGLARRLAAAAGDGAGACGSCGSCRPRRARRG